MAVQLGYWDAGALKRPSSSAPGFLHHTGTNFPWDSYEFDKDTQEHLYAFGKLPQAPTYIANATIKGKITWVTDASSTGTVRWRISARGVKSGETWDGTFTESATVDSQRTAANQKLEAEIEITSPSLEPGDSIIIKITRVADATEDNYGADASLTEFELLAA